MRTLGWVLRNPRIYRLSGWLVRNVGRHLPRWMLYNQLNVWGRQREIPPLPKQTFAELYTGRSRVAGNGARNRVGGKGAGGKGVEGKEAGEAGRENRDVQ